MKTLMITALVVATMFAATPTVANSIDREQAVMAYLVAVAEVTAAADAEVATATAKASADAVWTVATNAAVQAMATAVTAVEYGYDVENAASAVFIADAANRAAGEDYIRLLMAHNKATEALERAIRLFQAAATRADQPVDRFNN